MLLLLKVEHCMHAIELNDWLYCVCGKGRERERGASAKRTSVGPPFETDNALSMRAQTPTKQRRTDNHLQIKQQ